VLGFAEGMGDRERGFLVGLVIWNDALTDGLGRSGARYGLFFEPLSEGRVCGQWRIDVDDAVICAVGSAEDAVRRAEGLEAIRCIIRGLSPELDDDQLQYAEIIAREMMEAAEQALTIAPPSDQVNLLQSSRSLRSISQAIRSECARREREDGPPVLPLPN
jgi:hypothetical protein